MKTNLRRLFSTLLLAILIVNVFLCSMINAYAEEVDSADIGANADYPEISAGNTFQSATYYTIGNTYNGSITTSNTEDFYKFEFIYPSL